MYRKRTSVKQVERVFAVLNVELLPPTRRAWVGGVGAVLGLAKIALPERVESAAQLLPRTMTSHFVPDPDGLVRPCSQRDLGGPSTGLFECH